VTGGKRKLKKRGNTTPSSRSGRKWRQEGGREAYGRMSIEPRHFENEKRRKGESKLKGGKKTDLSISVTARQATKSGGAVQRGWGAETRGGKVDREGKNWKNWGLTYSTQVHWYAGIPITEKSKERRLKWREGKTPWEKRTKSQKSKTGFKGRQGVPKCIKRRKKTRQGEGGSLSDIQKYRN